MNDGMGLVEGIGGVVKREMKKWGPNNIISLNWRDLTMTSLQCHHDESFLVIES